VTFDFDAFVGGGEQQYRRVKTVLLLPPAATHLLEEHADLEADLQRIAAEDQRLNRKPQLPVAAQKILDMEEQIDAARVPFKVSCLGARAWLDLLAKHPPTKEQKRGNPKLDHNPESFRVAAIAAALVDPELTAEQVAQLGDWFTVAQWDELFYAVVEVNRGGGDAPKSLVAGAILRVRDESAPIAFPEGFPDPSSSGE